MSKCAKPFTAKTFAESRATFKGLKIDVYKVPGELYRHVHKVQIEMPPILAMSIVMHKKTTCNKFTFSTSHFFLLSLPFLSAR